MVIVDGNVLLYAVDTTAPEHARSRAWLDASLGGRETVGLPWVTLLAFLRVSTHARLMDDPLTGEEATAQVRSWLEEPAAIVAEPTSRHLDVVAGLLRSAGRAGPLVMDAHLAALAVEHDATVVSFDRDFARFEGVRHRLPS